MPFPLVSGPGVTSRVTFGRRDASLLVRIRADGRHLSGLVVAAASKWLGVVRKVHEAEDDGGDSGDGHDLELPVEHAREHSRSVALRVSPSR
jgi:hypothetical protein